MIYDVRIEPLPLMAMIDLKGGVEDIAPRLRRLGLAPPDANRASRSGALEVLRAAREHWLLRAPLEDEDRLLSALLEDVLASETLILPVSDAYAFFRIAGPDAREIMAIASPLQADACAFPADGATFTEAFNQKALVLQRPYGYDIAFERSYAQMAADYLSRINGGS